MANDGTAIGGALAAAASSLGATGACGGVTISGAAGPSAVPVATVVSPLPGARISKNTPIVVDVTDDKDSVRRALLSIEFPAIGVTDLAYDGAKFAGLYASGSTRSRITNGYRYSLLRAGGWPASPVFTPFVTDTDGGEAA